MKLLLLLCLVLSGCASADGYWQADMPNYRPSLILITEVDNIDKACGPTRVKPAACVLRHPNFAQVFIRTGLPKAQYECYMSHEIIGHVIRGMKHDDRMNFSPDCGPTS